ncbi:hypothetical protein ACEQPO_03230 [Bacillus sp. SL00103]
MKRAETVQTAICLYPSSYELRPEFKSLYGEKEKPISAIKSQDP